VAVNCEDIININDYFRKKRYGMSHKSHEFKAFNNLYKVNLECSSFKEKRCMAFALPCDNETVIACISTLTIASFVTTSLESENIPGTSTAYRVVATLDNTVENYAAIIRPLTYVWTVLDNDTTIISSEDNIVTILVPINATSFELNVSITDANGCTGNSDYLNNTIIPNFQKATSIKIKMEWANISVADYGFFKAYVNGTNSILIDEIRCDRDNEIVIEEDINYLEMTIDEDRSDEFTGNIELLETDFPNATSFDFAIEGILLNIGTGLIPITITSYNGDAVIDTIEETVTVLFNFGPNGSPPIDAPYQCMGVVTYDVATRSISFAECDIEEGTTAGTQYCDGYPLNTYPLYKYENGEWIVVTCPTEIECIEAGEIVTEICCDGTVVVSQCVDGEYVVISKQETCPAELTVLNFIGVSGNNASLESSYSDFDFTHDTDYDIVATDVNDVEKVCRQSPLPGTIICVSNNDITYGIYTCPIYNDLSDLTPPAFVASVVPVSGNIFNVELVTIGINRLVSDSAVEIRFVISDAESGLTIAFYNDSGWQSVGSSIGVRQFDVQTFDPIIGRYSYTFHLPFTVEMLRIAPKTFILTAYEKRSNQYGLIEMNDCEYKLIGWIIGITRNIDDSFSLNILDIE
jgi:hypothetical protein